MIGEKLVLSLRTKAPETAKTRFRLAAQALGNYFDAIAKGPQPLTRTQRTALVGDVYREAVRDLDTYDNFLDAIEATSTAFDANVAHHLGSTPVDESLDGIPARPADETAPETAGRDQPMPSDTDRRSSVVIGHDLKTVRFWATCQYPLLPHHKSDSVADAAPIGRASVHEGSLGGYRTQHVRLSTPAD